MVHFQILKDNYMDEGKFVADFIAKNIENIFNIGKKHFIHLMKQYK